MNENIFDEIVVRPRERRRYLSVAEIQKAVTAELENRMAGLGVTLNSVCFDPEEGIILINVKQKS